MKPILTSIDETIVVLLEGLGTVTLASEMDGGNTLGDAPVIVVEGHITDRADSGREKLLERKVRHRQERSMILSTYSDLSFVDVCRKVGYNNLVSGLRGRRCWLGAVCCRSDTSASGGAVGGSENLSLACTATTGAAASIPGTGGDDLADMCQQDCSSLFITQA